MDSRKMSTTAIRLYVENPYPDTVSLLFQEASQFASWSVCPCGQLSSAAGPVVVVDTYVPVVLGGDSDGDRSGPHA